MRARSGVNTCHVCVETIPVLGIVFDGRVV
jgi:hypothetical protein